MIYVQEGELDLWGTGKAGGPPGDAFDLVYAPVLNSVWQQIYKLDSHIGECMRCSPCI